MSLDYDTRHSTTSITDAEGVIFAPTPVWERGRKRRGAGRPKSAAQTATGAGLTAAHAPRAEPKAPASRRGARPNGAMTAVAAASVVALGAAAAGAWYLSNDGDDVPELSPGMTTTEVAAAPVLPLDVDQTTPAAIEPPMAEMAPPPAEPPRAVARVERQTPRARPAATAPDASATGVNASATVALPEGPQPYTSLNPEAASQPAPVNPPLLSVPPASAAPAPAEIPATPPIVTPQSSTEDPVAPEDTIPPTAP